MPTTNLDLATAALCLLPDGRRCRRVDLDRSFVARIEDVRHGDEGAYEECEEIPFAKLVGTSTWNDPVELAISDCAIERFGTDCSPTPDHLPLGQAPPMTCSPLLADRGAAAAGRCASSPQSLPRGWFATVCHG
ncbi:hypothetical protein GCM10009797_41380 [Nocardioides hwasunensis]